jgi:hypothetical protein
MSSVNKSSVNQQVICHLIETSFVNKKSFVNWSKRHLSFVTWSKSQLIETSSVNCHLFIIMKFLPFNDENAAKKYFKNLEKFLKKIYQVPKSKQTIFPPKINSKQMSMTSCGFLKYYFFLVNIKFLIILLIKLFNNFILTSIFIKSW